MRVSDVLAAGGLIIGPPWRTFEEAVEGLVDSLVAHGQVPAALREQAVRVVCERERMASTEIVEIGVSIPHARLPGITRVVAAIAGSTSAVYYAMAGVPITVMALVLSPPDLAGEHLNFLSSLSMLLQSEKVRRGLGQAADSAAALALLRAQKGG
jgi:mannitol/fructose-specific phosphotransferase system IIA component (Ntr-type)